MNSDTYKQAFSALHASEEIKLESDMEERKTNSKFHARPALAVCLCVAAALGCFSTAFALDAGGMKTAVEDGVKTIQLKAGEIYKDTGKDGSEQIIEVSEDCEFDIDVVKDETDETVIVEIRDEDTKDDTDERVEKVEKAKSSNSESENKSSDDAKDSK